MSSNSDSLDGLNPASSSANLSQRSHSSVRPRNRRLISFNEEEEVDIQHSTASKHSSSLTGLTPPHSRGTTPSPYPSRRGSPLPSKGSPWVSERGFDERYRSDDERPRNRDSFQAYGSSQTSSGFLESSWSSFQNLASSMLGNELKWSKPGPSSTYHTKRRKPSRSDVPVSLSKQAGPLSWGPPISPTPQIGAGTKEERQAMVQAKKREALLLSNGDSLLDLRNQYKRKDSIEGPDARATDPELDEEALVYVHHVQPNDSMTGLSIKYGCQLAIFRKANGFWPTDSLQTRKIVLLPAEACSIKGRRVNNAKNTDLLADDPWGHDCQEDLLGSSIAPSELEPEQREIQQKSDETERTWKHEAWVQMDGFPEPVEIGRVPRKTLGFFPRSRRKSLSVPYSDTEPSSNPAIVLPQTNALSQPNQRDNSRDNSPYNSLYSSRMDSGSQSPLRTGRTTHKRTGSITLHGPGGVGTLGREVHAPGPAQDGLNKFVSQHLPNLSIHPPPTSSPSSLPMRKASFDSTSSAISATSSSTGLENFGGAIEGWMRKMALRAKSGLNEFQIGSQQGGLSSSQQGQALGIAGLGDLIELNDDLEASSMTSSLHTDALNSSNNSSNRNGYLTGRGPHHSNQAIENSQYQRFSKSPSSTSRARPFNSGSSSAQDEPRNKND